MVLMITALQLLSEQKMRSELKFTAIFLRLQLLFEQKAPFLFDHAVLKMKCCL